MKKYEFTGETKISRDGKLTLRRIRAVADFGIVKTGELGGWIEKAENLSQNGNAWVSGNARVFGNAWVSGNARVFGDAEVFGNAWVSGNARVFGDAEVFGNAWVFGDAEVSGDAKIFRISHYFVIGPAGSRFGFTTFFRNKSREVSVTCGCFKGTLEEFLEKVGETHRENKHAIVYRAAAELAKMQIDLTEEEEE